MADRGCPSWTLSHILRPRNRVGVWRDEKVQRTGNPEAQGDPNSEESRGSDREDRGRARARFQGRVEIQLNVRGEPQALEDRVTVIELRSPLRIARGLGH